MEAGAITNADKNSQLRDLLQCLLPALQSHGLQSLQQEKSDMQHNSESVESEVKLTASSDMCHFESLSQCDIWRNLPC